MASEEIIDLLDLVERGKGAKSPSSSHGASDFKRELDDLFADEPESAAAERSKTSERDARPGDDAQASEKKSQSVDFNEKLEIPDMSDLDGLLDGLDAKNKEFDPLEEPEPVMHFPDSMKSNGGKKEEEKYAPSTFNLDDLHADIDQLIAKDSSAEKQGDTASSTEMDNLDSLLDDILSGAEPQAQDEEPPSLGADDIFDDIVSKEEPLKVRREEGGAPSAGQTGGQAQSQDWNAMERSVLLAKESGADDAASSFAASGVSGLSEDDVRALVRAEIAPLSEAASPERLTEIVRKELASLPPALAPDDVRNLVEQEVDAKSKPVSSDEIRNIAREEFAAMPKPFSLKEVSDLVHTEIAALPVPLSPDEIKAIIHEEIDASLSAPEQPVSLESVRELIREEIRPLGEAVTPERITEAVRAQIAWWPRPFTADDIRGIVCKELAAASKPASSDEIRDMVREELAAAPSVPSSEEIRDMVKTEFAALPKALSADDVRAYAREALEEAPKPLSMDDVRGVAREELAAASSVPSSEEIRDMVKAELAALPKPVSIEEIRELVQAEIFAAIPDTPPVAASQVRGVVREELDLRLSALEERLAAKVLEEVQKTVEQVAAKAAAAVIREEIAALAEEL